jgi:predicted acylesterase/phospholipase RssA
MKLRADAVFEGGGVKGIGLVGAVAEIEKAGYEFVNLAGTSAGAIVASLLAVDYKADLRVQADRAGQEGSEGCGSQPHQQSDQFSEIGDRNHDGCP